jgi:hypothetical protein
VSVLEVVTPSRRSTLESVHALLFGLRVQVVRVESFAHPAGLVECFHVVEFDGAPISRRRAEAIRKEMHRALRAVHPSRVTATS